MNESVNELTGNFLDKARFCSEYMENEKRLMDHYHEFLRKEIWEFVKLDCWRRFEELVIEARSSKIETKRDDGGSIK